MSARSDQHSWLIALSSLEGVGSATLRKVVDDGDAERSWKRVCAEESPCDREFNPSTLRRWSHAAKSIDPAERLDAHHGAGIALTTWNDGIHPGDSTADPYLPPLLFWSSPVDWSRAPKAVAIVGTRKATRYGLDIATEFGAELTSSGHAVVSGLALGIDAGAHRGSVSFLERGAGGPAAGIAAGLPVGVVASGLDVIYPKRNAALWNSVRERGVLVSEYPLGTPPAQWRFPARNRIIVGLADSVCVIESHEQGGSLITARYAAQRGVPVLAVPGPIRSAAARGTNRLIADGAVPLLELEDIYVSLGLSSTTCGQGALPLEFDTPSTERAAAKHEADLSPAATEVLYDIGWEVAAVDELMDRSRLSVAQVATALVELSRRGFIRQDGGRIERTVATPQP